MKEKLALAVLALFVVVSGCTFQASVGPQPPPPQSFPGIEPQSATPQAASPSSGSQDFSRELAEHSPFSCSLDDLSAAVREQAVSSPLNSDYLPASKAPHRVKGSFSDFALKFKDSKDGFSFKASKVVVTKRDSFGVWGHLDSGGETSNVYAGESVTIEGDLTVSFGSFPGEIEFRNGKALVQRAKVSSVGAVKFSGDLEASDTLGGPKDPKAMIEAPGSASYSVVWGEVEVPSSFRVTSRDAEFNGTLDFEGKKTLTGKIGLAGGDVEFFNGILEGQASQVYLNGLPQLEASLAVEPKTLCYTATRGKRVLIPLALKESSGNTTADNLKVSLFTEKGNALGVAVHEGIGDVLFDLFTAAFTFGLSLFVDEPRSLSPNGSMQLDLVSNSPLESEQKAVLMVACDNCESLQVPVIIRPS